MNPEREPYIPDEDWDEYVKPEKRDYSTKKDHRERSEAHQPNHRNHWKKERE